MNRRFSNLAICILGSAFLTLLVNQMKASASTFIVKSETQRVNELANLYRLAQQKSPLKLQDTTLIAQVDFGGIVDSFGTQSNQIVEQHRQRVEQPQQQRLQNSTQTSPYDHPGSQGVVDSGQQQINSIESDYNRDSKNEVQNLPPGFGFFVDSHPRVNY